ncbi:dipeptidyl-peptidase-3 [Flexibacter flexilis DSM 6793]|uniref:Dipeptidyl-peptidase-3 n=1 Tax=Flexibacter flexilis DSM 6793 TaxID=927664 RepID=A0A1I1MFW9_9BACT|nr:dihydrofolate reductase [Flexibacter flexilis]SFC84381.1 dipeptidyl-peptidase-3 [Flexibacter flexilis DSM 6793]
MKKNNLAFSLILSSLALSGVAQVQKPTRIKGLSVTTAAPDPAAEAKKTASTQVKEGEFEYVADQFADLQVLRYQVPGFETLTPKQKEMAYYLSQAALSGRDMVYDQNYKHNLRIRRMLEAVVAHYPGDRKEKNFQLFMTYAKRVWFSNGIHHHYSTKKIMPEFKPDYFAEVLVKTSAKAKLPTRKGQSVEQLVEELTPIIFEEKVDAKRVNQENGADLIASSANNFYEGLKQEQVEAYYKKLASEDKNPSEPVSYGLNSKMVMGKDGKVTEKVWKVGGMYSKAIEKMVFWIEKAIPLAENAAQKQALTLLVKFYKTGDLKAWDDYNIAWVKDTDSRIDFVNGFIEVYGDALGYKATYESVLSIKDLDATKRIAAIGADAQWFEDNSPIQKEHKKEKVTGISAKVITVVTESGDGAPATPIGINLPNANWIRQKHGSKSVSLGNIVAAYDHVKSSGKTLDEFAFSQEEIDRAKKFGVLAGYLHTDMHEVIGHASGQINKGVGTPKETLKSYASTLEEARADLVALYYLMDEHLVKLGVMPSVEVGQTEYDGYIRNGMMLQLNRLDVGEQLEEAHMRNRQLVASWAFEQGRGEVITREQKDGKTFFVVKDYNALRKIFGKLLAEIQRITSEGDYEAGKKLVETYGVKVDEKLHKEIRERYAKLNSVPYSGFIQPKLVAVKQGEKIVDVKVEYPNNFVEQMLDYGKNYSFLPDEN